MMKKVDNRLTLLPRDLLFTISKRLKEKDLGHLKATCRFFDDLFAIELHERITSRLKLDYIIENHSMVILRATLIPNHPDPWEILKDKRYDRVISMCCAIITSEVNPELIDVASERLRLYRPVLCRVNRYMFKLVEAISIYLDKGLTVPKSLRETVSQFHMDWIFIEKSDNDSEFFTSTLARQFLWFFEHRVLANPRSNSNIHINQFCYYLFYYQAHKIFAFEVKKHICELFQNHQSQEPSKKKQKIDIGLDTDKEGTSMTL